METILKRDRAIVIAALAGISLLAWGYMVYEARAMYHTGVCCCAGLKMSGPDTDPWSPATLLPLFLMWTEMMVAMMIPSAAPMILTFAVVQRKRREQERPFVPTGVFLLGYLIVWTLFSALAAFQTHLVGLDSEHFRHTDAQLFTLDNGGDKTGHFRDAQTVRHILERFAARLAQLHFANGSRKCQGEFVFPFFADL